MQPSEVGLPGPGLTSEVRLDLLRYIHLTPHASNELSHAGSDGRRPSIAGVRCWMAVSREQNDHPLVPRGALCESVYSCRTVTSLIAGVSGDRRPWGYRS